MTRKIDLPPEQHVRTVMAAMLADAAGGGPRPTVLALARSLGLANATFWRHYHDIATELCHHAAQARQAVPAPDQNQRRQPARRRPQPPAAADHRQRRTPPRTPNSPRGHPHRQARHSQPRLIFSRGAQT